MTDFNPAHYFPADLENIRIVRTKPRVEMHRLAQLCDASPPRRRQLISQEKYPSPYRVTYEPAKRLFREAVRLDWDAETLFGTASQRWFGAPVQTDLADFRRRQAMDAVAEFCELLEPLRETIKELECVTRLSGRLWQPLKLGGVDVVDAPILVLRRANRSGDVVGVVSVHASKTLPHHEHSMQQAAALLVQVARENKTESTTLDPAMCLVVDAFSNSIASAADLGLDECLGLAELVCEEVAAMWEHV